MSSTALALLLAAAAGHAGWNLLVKKAGDRQLFTSISLVVAAVVLAPAWITPPMLPMILWPLILASAVAEAAYFTLLVAMYAVSDFSLAYPLARGAAPLFLVVWTASLLHQVPTRGGFIGLAILATGLFVVAAAGTVRWGEVARAVRPGGLEAGKSEADDLSASSSPRDPLLGRGLVLSLTAAVCISAYTLIDGFAMQYTSPARYLGVVLALTAILIMPFVLWHYGWVRVVAEWRANWWRILLVGGGMAITYQLVLIAFRLAPIPYVGAVREVSVIFGAVAGWKLLGEPLGRTRVVGAVIIFIGAMCIVALG